MAFELGMTVDLCMAYMLILVSMTLTLMQGHISLIGRGTFYVLNFLDS